MPESTATITGEQRDAIYELVRDHLGGLDDIWKALRRQRDFATAERLGREFRRELRLLDDLGWPEEDDRELVELTMPAEELAPLLARLQGDAAEGLSVTRAEREARDVEERLAAEAPGFFAMPANSVKDGWARQTGSPSEEALRLRRRVQAAMDKCAPVNFDGKPSAEIVTVTEPPPQIYFAQEEGDPFSGTEVTDLPSKEAWPWFRDDDGGVFGYNAKPFEAVVVKNWLGRFHLIGAVSGENGSRPVGIWAIPDRQHFHEDGAVDAQDPDAKAPVAAKRKPPRPGGDDDIPF